MRDIKEIQKNQRLTINVLGRDGGYATAYLSGSKKPTVVVFSFSGGWDHVSVSYKNRTPTCVSLHG